MVFYVFNKIMQFLRKNIKLIFKCIWGTVLLILGIYYICTNYKRIVVSMNLMDKAIIAGVFVLIFLPFVSEVSLMGFSLKKEIKNTKQEVKEGLVDLRSQIVDIKAITMQNNTQTLNIGYLPSKDEMSKILEENNEMKISEEKAIYGSENENKFRVSDDSVYLFKVRFTLDKLIDELLNKEHIFSHETAIRRLKNSKLISTNLLNQIIQVRNICNRGIHGEIISKEYIAFVRKIVPNLYKQLEQAAKHTGDKYYIVCPRCKFSGYSEYKNSCPSCGYVFDDD